MVKNIMVGKLSDGTKVLFDVGLVSVAREKAANEVEVFLDDFRGSQLLVDISFEDLVTAIGNAEW